MLAWWFITDIIERWEFQIAKSNEEDDDEIKGEGNKLLFFFYFWERSFENEQ